MDLYVCIGARYRAELSRRLFALALACRSALPDALEGDTEVARVASSNESTARCGRVVVVLAETCVTLAPRITSP